METSLIFCGICDCSCTAIDGASSSRATGHLSRGAELFGPSDSVHPAVLSAAGSSSNRLRCAGYQPAWQRGYSGRSGCLKQGSHLVLDCLCSWRDLQYDYQYYGGPNDSAAIAILKTDRAKLSDTSPPALLPIAERGAKAIYCLIAACGAIAAALLLYFFAPDQHAFYPRCLFHAITGLQCPGCGGLRAAHRLLHGDLAGAWRLNPLLIMGVPIAAAWFIAYQLHQRIGWPQTRYFRESTWGWVIAAVAVLFGIARNWPK